jgi:hypothetical protein
MDEPVGCIPVRPAEIDQPVMPGPVRTSARDVLECSRLSA